MKITILKAVKKVFITFKLEKWAFTKIFEVGFGGEIFQCSSWKDRKDYEAGLEELRRCGENTVIIRKGYGCTCSKNRYYTYHHNPDGPDEVIQCAEAGFQWDRVREDIDKYPKQQPLFPIEIPEQFEKIYPPGR